MKEGKVAENRRGLLDRLGKENFYNYMAPFAAVHFGFSANLILILRRILIPAMTWRLEG